MLALFNRLGDDENDPSLFQVGTLIKSLNLALKSLKTWMSPKKVILTIFRAMTLSGKGIHNYTKIEITQFLS